MPYHLYVNITQVDNPLHVYNNLVIEMLYCSYVNVAQISAAI